MKAFTYVNTYSLRSASEELGKDRDRALVIAGGVDLLTEMKERIIEPDKLVNIKTIPGLDRIRVNSHGLTLGALVTLSTIAADERIRKEYPALAEAALSVGSPQIRNVGTIGGNLCQRPRCWYYRDETIKCLKKGGSRCYAADEAAENKFNAILGGGPSYIVHPSDCATALVALDAVIGYSDGGGHHRKVAAEDFFILPRDNPRRENILGPEQILTEIRIRAPRRGTRSTYLKFKEKDSFDWAVSAVAAVAVTDHQGTIQNIRIVLGGVAPKPWRSREAEEILKGKSFTPDLVNQAAVAALQGAKPLGQNAYKVPLTRVLVRRAVEQVVTGRQVG